MNPKSPLPTHCVALLPFLLALSEGQLLGQVVIGPHLLPHLPPLPWLVPHELVTGAGVSKVVVLKPGATGQGVVSRADIWSPWLIPGTWRHWQFSWSFPPSTPSLVVPLAVLDSHGKLLGDDGRMVVQLEGKTLLVLMFTRAHYIRKMLLVVG